MQIYTSRNIDNSEFDKMIPSGVFRLMAPEVMRELDQFERFRILNLVELSRTRRSLQREANALRERNSRGDRAEAVRLAREADKIARLAEEYAWRSAKQNQQAA